MFPEIIVKLDKFIKTINYTEVPTSKKRNKKTTMYVDGRPESASLERHFYNKLEKSGIGVIDLSGLSIPRPWLMELFLMVIKYISIT